MLKYFSFIQFNSSYLLDRYSSTIYLVTLFEVHCNDLYAALKMVAISFVNHFKFVGIWWHWFMSSLKPCTYGFIAFRSSYKPLRISLFAWESINCCLYNSSFSIKYICENRVHLTHTRWEICEMRLYIFQNVYFIYIKKKKTCVFN